MFVVVELMIIFCVLSWLLISVSVLFMCLKGRLLVVMWLIKMFVICFF